ncbi:hypothetical protein SKAU_G00376930 [Synaphobranchus kaupii]|uniref:Claudin n=1 Tax=Synaphobranchus kaupii TaxID=118154 RepID=A0A9Q1ECX3_SYNKA|nr:hypothetical protein SKAU_G00376930 [Synaphobranchus kaupii]
MIPMGSEPLFITGCSDPSAFLATPLTEGGGEKESGPSRISPDKHRPRKTGSSGEWKEANSAFEPSFITKSSRAESDPFRKRRPRVSSSFRRLSWSSVSGETRVAVAMVSAGRQALGFSLAGVGAVGVVVICALPMWKVTAFIAASIVTSQVFWEGLWMNCVLQSTGHMQCKAYDSLLALPRDLQAARALVVLAIAVSVVGALLGFAGGRCTNFLRRNAASKARVAIGSGVAFIAAGILCLIPVCWTASTLVTGFYNPLVPTGQKGELGAALYVGWMAGGLLVLGGAILTSTCPPRPAPTLPPPPPPTGRVGVAYPLQYPLHAPSPGPSLEQEAAMNSTQPRIRRNVRAGECLQCNPGQRRSPSQSEALSVIPQSRAEQCGSQAVKRTLHRRGSE